MLLLIRHAQLESLLGAPREAYFLRLERTARALFPKRAAELGEDVTRTLVRRVAESAESSGFATEREVAHVVHLYFLLGPEFEERSDLEWVLDLLGDTTRAPTARIDEIYARLGELATGVSR